jgi:CelD/BcsL family acetyltransferase involved in cellulose biosynthesis
MGYTVQREELGGLEAEWLGLLELSPEPLPFLHPLWQRVWLEEFQEDSDLLLLSVREGGGLVGVAPLLRRNGRLSLVGHYSICDYMDFVVTPELDRAFFGALLESLREQDWDELDLRGLREASPTLSTLPALAEGLGFQVSRELEAVSPRLELPATWEEYLSRLSKKDRHELRRKLRRLAQYGDVRLQVLTSPEETARGLEDLLRFMVESREDKARFMTEKMGQFFRHMVAELSKVGLVRLYALELDGQAVASILCFDLGGCIYLYNSGYDPAYSFLGVGLLSKALCLRDAIEQGRRCLDFLRGNESYKYDLGGKDQPIYRCQIRRC